jgi:PDZ domain-containing protein
MAGWAPTFARENSTSDVDTTESIVLPSGARTDAASRTRRRIRWLWWAIALNLAAAVAGGSFAIDLPYYAIAPGTATDVGRLLETPKDLSYPPQGKVLLTTVSLQRVDGVDALRGWLDPNVDVVPEEQILGKTPSKNFRQQNVQEMDDSKLIAEVVALRKLGYDVPERGAGALVGTVAAKSPADGRLKVGDVVTAIDDKPVRLATDLVAALATRHFGDVVKLTVTTAGQPARAESIKLGGSNADKSECSADKPNTGRGCLGIGLGTKSHQFDRPVKITIDSQGIGGPSAGLAFVLAIMDELRPGELTGGKKIAVTGTIDLNGRVGDVGGVVQKTAAVRASGAEAFLVPPGEYASAKSHAGPHLQVIRVATLDEALQALGRLGGDLKALAPPTTVKPTRH